ncbi:V-type ATP synthase subunit K [Spirochaetia bacterium 38H-sp]|uniref:V-type ATP synthase subunit K n=1 Tax=Rarispira pelagica TaxID=3141764 RepID=A0ABU9UAM5_9SPIR
MNLGLIGIGAALGLAAAGSALGIGTAGMAAIGAMKKCYAQNKPAPFILIAFVGAPLTQTIYGYLLMGNLLNKQSTLDPWLMIGLGLFGGLAMGFSAWLQGKAGAAASDSLAETGKGTGNYLMIIGLVETVAVFVLVFMMTING